MQSPAQENSKKVLVFCSLIRTFAADEAIGDISDGGDGAGDDGDGMHEKADAGRAVSGGLVESKRDTA